MKGEGTMFKERKTKGFLLASMMLGATLVTTGCGGNDAGADGADNAAEAAENGGAVASEQNTLVVAQNADAITLDPHGTNDVNSAIVMTQIYQTLVNQDENMEIYPGLAESWEQIDDLTWEFNLREDVYFHNGEPFTAEDVKFSFQRASEAAVVAPIVGEINADSIEIIDDHTVRVGTHEPFAPILAHMAHIAAAIINEEAVNEHGEDFGQNPVGTGPFEFVNWNVGDRVELVRNENFHGDLPEFEELVIRSITEASSRTIELETGQVDIALQLAPADVRRVDEHADLTLFEETALATSFIMMNMQQEPFDNILVRQAINYALDVETIIYAVTEGTGIPGRGPIGENVFGAHPDIENYPFDVERAQELMDEAGIDGFSTELTIPNAQTSIDIATIVANQLSEIGINVEIDVLEWGVFTEVVDAGEHDMASMGWGSITGDADYGLYPLFHSSQWGAAGNRAFYANDRVDELLDYARGTTDEQARLDAYHEVQEIIMEEAPWVVLNHQLIAIGTQNSVNGFIAYPTNAHPFWNVYFTE